MDSTSSSSSSSSIRKGGRAMVKKFRWQEIRRKVWSPTEPPPSRLFSEPQWQSHVSMWYVLYRWFIFICWGAFIICSLFEIGSRRSDGRKQTWPIYLTHWDLVLGLIQGFLGAMVVTRRWKLQSRDIFDPDTLALGRVEHVYWVLYTVTSSLAICVSVIYWGSIYDPKIHTKDPLNFMLHLFNTILMVIDLMIVAVPLKFSHFWWPVVCVVTYLIFTLFYYLAGGLDKHGYHYIYKILDWQRPGRSILICLAGLTFLVFVHCTLCAIAKLKVYVRARAVGTIGGATLGNQVTKTAAGVEFPLPTAKSVELIV